MNLRLRLRGGVYIPPIPPPSQTPILQDISYVIGQLTTTFNGYVRLSSSTLGLLADGSPPVSTWTIGAATTGTSSHWTRPSAAVAEGSSAITPKPSGTIGTISGTYAFPVTATGADGSTSNTATITITVLANAASIGDQVEGGPAWTVGDVPTFEGSSGNPKSLILSVGANRTTFRGEFYSHPFTSEVTVRNADPDNPVLCHSMEWSSTNNVKFDGILCGGDSALGGSARFYLNNCNDIVVDDLQVISTRALMGVLPAVRLAGTCDNITFNSPSIIYAFEGFVTANGQTISNVTVNDAYIRYFGDNTAIVGSAIDWTWNDLLMVAPIRPTGSTEHNDGLQITDNSVLTNYALNRVMFVQADGDALAGPIFSDGAYANWWRANGLLLAGRAYHGLTMGGTAGTSYTRNFTLFKLDGPNINVEVQSPDQADEAVTEGPWLQVTHTDDDDNHSGTHRVSSGFIYDQITYVNLASGVGSKPSEWTIDSDVFEADIRAGQNTTSVLTNYFASNPATILNAITSAEWEAMDAADIRALMKSTFTPKVGGTLDAGSGVAKGAIGFDGEWNTFVPT